MKDFWHGKLDMNHGKLDMKHGKWDVDMVSYLWIVDLHGKSDMNMVHKLDMNG